MVVAHSIFSSFMSLGKGIDVRNPALSHPFQLRLILQNPVRRTSVTASNSAMRHEDVLEEPLGLSLDAWPFGSRSVVETLLIYSSPLKFEFPLTNEIRKRNRLPTVHRVQRECIARKIDSKKCIAPSGKIP